MTEDSNSRVSSSESDLSITKQRKRRWDQPDESLVCGVVASGIFPSVNVGSLSRITLPYVSLTSSAPIAIPFSASSATSLQVPLQQHAAAFVQKLIQPKIQDELVAREVVINDADSTIRYKLTRRQTQEEIQKCTGTVVITRGKYRPPNAPPDGERPLYLHISAAAHLETTAERIKAVDHAAAMVEEMIKDGLKNNGVKVDHLLNACVFVGFEADPSMNLASRIRGPNDKYVNHIMNETGATVLLRGCSSGNSVNEHTEEAQQPLHFFLSSNDPKSLEHAKLLAENLLDTISTECGASRISSLKVYGALPPPPILKTGVLGNTSMVNVVAGSSSTHSVGGTTQGPLFQSIAVSNPGPPLANTASHPHASVNIGTSYIGYGGIYPQATPLQQVALALRQSTSPVTATVDPSATAASTEAPAFLKDKRPPKRKFKEMTAAITGSANLNQKNLQGSEFPVPRELTSNVGARDISGVQSTNKIVRPLSNGMPPPPRSALLHPPPPKVPSSNGIHPPVARSALLPPPPPKFNSTPKLHGVTHAPNKSKPEVVPDTLVKLMEYGDDDVDDDDDV